MKNIIILLFSLVMIACGGGGGGESSEAPVTDPNTTFVFSELNRIPNIGDTETINLAGNVDGSGESVSMSLTIKNSGTTTYNGELVNVEDIFGNIKIPAFSIDKSTIFTYYYDNNGTFVRYYDNDSGKICLASGSVTPYPSKVKVGDFGSTIPHSCSDGSTSSGTWKVEGVDATHANIIFNETKRDSFGDISSVTVATLKIDTDGNVSDVSIKITYYSYGSVSFSVSLSGTLK